MTTRAPCRACEENARALRGEDPWALARTSTGVVRLNPVQYHRGAVFFVALDCVAEVFELDAPARTQHLDEMSEVAAAVMTCTGAMKMNYEALGNSVPHLHWWLTPRHADDRRPHGPIWEDLDFLRAQWTGDPVLGDEAVARLRGEMVEALAARHVDGFVELRSSGG